MSAGSAHALGPELVLATRSSPLALWQAETTARALAASDPECKPKVLALRSSGDRDVTTPLVRFGSIGIFTAEGDAAVLDGRAHAAVHSLKDQTTTLPEGLVLAAVLPRGPVEDALVSAGGVRFDALPAGARLATGSTRRAAMVRSARPDLELVPLRGNVASRLGAIERGEAEALLMARAALVRLGLEERIAEVLGTERFVPAVSQGIVGIVCRAEDRATRETLAGWTTHRPMRRHWPNAPSCAPCVAVVTCPPELWRRSPRGAWRCWASCCRRTAASVWRRAWRDPARRPRLWVTSSPVN
jgi:hydroxymethylbilane synthase